LSLRLRLRPHTQGSGLSPAAGKKTDGQIEKETNSSPQSSQRTLRKRIYNYLCVLSGLCGEIFLVNGIGFHEVSYEKFRVLMPYGIFN
jgi:hypothetical protein